jgi:ferric-dicitrate binding protein FerR (iron transport regulator)
VLTAWKDRSVILPSNTRFADIIPALEENYGVHIELSTKGIAEKAIEGTLPLTDQQNLFFILSNVLKVDISEKDGIWTFTSR